MSYKLVIKDAFWQIVGRMFSAIAGFIVIKIITPYLGPLRYGDYTTILSYFVLRSALSDLGLYVLGLKELGEKTHGDKDKENTPGLSFFYSQIVRSRLLLIVVVYTIALVVAYLLPAYTENPYLIRGLPLGMFFSGVFMGAGIMQLPLQLYRKMEQVSIALVLARVAQIGLIICIVYILFPQEGFAANTIPLEAFIAIFISICVSSIIQFAYVYWKSGQHIRLRRVPFVRFTWQTIIKNWKYGIAFFLSSFHISVVVILLSLYFPTTDGFAYVGIWGLPLQLITILLIVPSSLGNSLLHKLSHVSVDDKKKSFGNFLTLMIWIGGLFVLNFSFFAQHIVFFIGGKDYISTSAIRNSVGSWLSEQKMIGSDIILIFLSIILLLSFVKQVFNYIFIAHGKQNSLFLINSIGVVVGTIVGVYTIPRWSIIGGICTQLVFEILFVIGCFFVATYHKILPIVRMGHIFSMSIFFIGVYFLLVKTIHIPYDNQIFFIAAGLGINILIIGIWFKFLLDKAKNLLHKET